MDIFKSRFSAALAHGTAYRELNENLKVLTLFSGVATFVSVILSPIWGVYVYEYFGQPPVAIGALFGFSIVVSFFMKQILAPISARTGKKKLLLFSGVSMVVFPLFYVVAPSMWMLLLALLAAGLKDGIHGHTTSALISESAEIRILPKAYGVINAISGLVTCIAPIVGGLIAWLWGMKTVFYAASAASIGGMIVIAYVKDQKEASSEKRRIKLRDPFHILRDFKEDARTIQIFAFVKLWSMMISGSLNALLALYLYLRLKTSLIGLGIFFTASFLLINNAPSLIRCRSDNEADQKSFIAKIFIARAVLVALLMKAPNVYIFFVIHGIFHYLGNQSSPALSKMQINRVPRQKRAGFVTLLADMGEFGLVLGAVLGGLMWQLWRPSVFFGACALGSALIPLTLAFLKNGDESAGEHAGAARAV